VTTTTTYLARGVLDELDQAQAVIDRHLVGCVVCGTSRPCDERRVADRVFLRYERLPRRRPGLAGAGTYTPARFGWFDSSPVAADGT
jgi:hypothetical protein